MSFIYDCRKCGVSMTAWDKVKKARKAGRPTAIQYIRDITEEFIELHGDRLRGDDKAIIGGIGKINDLPITVIGQEKGRKINEKIKRNFGMAKPDGYRKALRLMKQAEKFQRPILCIIDTAGAFCGIEAEENGQGEAIARNIFELSTLTVPILSIIIGEGGSGGALALAVSDQVWMLENAIYTILSPEGFASILYKDASLAPKAAAEMKITADELIKLNVIDEIIYEPNEGVHESYDSIIKPLKERIYQTMINLQRIEKEELVERRYIRCRKFC